MSFLSVASYVLLSWGLYAIAKRRGIHKPWLAWIPVVNIWILGCISDQYRQVARGQVKAKRKALLTLTIITYALIIIGVILMVVWFAGLIGTGGLNTMDWSAMADMSDEEIVQVVTDWATQLTQSNMDYLQSTLWMLMAVGVMSLALFGVAIAIVVLELMAYADVFKSCDPANAKMFTILGIVLSLMGMGIVLAVLVFLCKDKDFGMPPRTQMESTPIVDAEM